MTSEGKATTQRAFPLRDGMLGGVNTTLPAHLLKSGEWRTQHNFRLTPTITQIPPKVVNSTFGGVSEDIRWLGMVPQLPGYGKVLAFTPSQVLDMSGHVYASALANDSTYRRWAVAMYDSTLYYCNELNSVHKNNGTSDSAITGAPSGRYLSFWYDHMVIGYPVWKGVTYPNRVMISALGFFADVTVTLSSGSVILYAWDYNEKKSDATYYDFVEWQQPDYPYTGVTGVGKLRGTLWIYTPTAIIPLLYVGLPKVIQVEERAMITRAGNTFPWTLVCLDQLHLFYDGIEQMFWAFDGQTLSPIGEPIRGYITDNLNPDPALAQKMYGYIDVDNREVWWPFVSVESTGAYDKAVVFNYRTKTWSTASVENVQAFVGAARTIGVVSGLVGTVGELVGTVASLGLGAGATERLFGADSGNLLREVTVNDDPTTVLPFDQPVLETPDYHYSDIRTTKENDLMVINAKLDAGEGPTVQVEVSGRSYLGEDVNYEVVGQWLASLPDGMLTYAGKAGRVFRYRFTFNQTLAATFAAFSESVYQKRAEK